jgi:16S rRNA (cytosine1402-N4)-methyltransferase
MNEVITHMAPEKSDIIIDATLNGGGHASEILSHLGDTGVFVGIDVDQEAINNAQVRFKDASCQCHFVHENFKNIDHVLESISLNHADKILFDLGWSSNQFENPERGFSFAVDGPLLMNLNTDMKAVTFTAYDIVNTWDEEHIIDILKGYGEERYAKRIAGAMVQKRGEKNIISTGELAALISESVPSSYRHGRIHPATKTFQALRIAVNDEINVLKEGLQKSFEVLVPGGKIIVISFHSIEDRVVKHYFKSLSNEQKARIITKKPLTASDEERGNNPRSRSAKLRVLQKV